MKIGLDLDGTVYKFPQFFARLIESMSAMGHEFYSISSHSRQEFDHDDRKRLDDLGVPEHLISSELMNKTRHGDLCIKGMAADKCDIVFDDDPRLKDYTSTPVFVPMGHMKAIL